MAKHLHQWDRAKYERYLSEGRGFGEGKDYKPWILVQDFSSQGTVSRISGYKSGRIHHFMSRNELYYFYILEWSDNVLDIREQYPLHDINLAMKLAKDVGIKYPCDKSSGFPYVLTCDFMITTRNGLKARTIKHSQELSDKRTLEKLEVERRYWERLSVDWAIVTENEISIEKAKFIEWIYAANQIPLYLKKEKIINTVIEKFKNTSIHNIATETEKQFGLEPGSGVLIIKYLFLKKLLSFDFENYYVEIK